MDASASEYHHGDQDSSAHVATYEAFMSLSKWGSLVVSAAILMLSLWFCTDAGFLGGLISGVVLLVLGIVFLRSKPDSGQ
jgi:thiamine transporter ThiT